MRILFFILVPALTCLAQDDSRMLYDDSEVAIMNIFTSQEALDFMYEFTDSDSIHYANIHFQNAYINEVVDSVGFRLRGNTSRVSAKKSFKLDFEYFKDGREFYGVDKMNINGEHNDPSIIRSKLAWDFFKEAGIISSRAAHCAVYINNVYYGLYISIEHYDREFLRKNFEDPEGNLWKCLYPADFNIRGTGQPQDYDPVFTGNRGYELTTNEAENDYSELAEFISRINNTTNTQFYNQMFEKTDFPGIIKVMAWDVILGMWDNHWSNVNNFYLYHDPSADKIHFIPYDYDNTMSIDWFERDWATENIYDWYRLNNNPRPLVDRILANNELRNLYSHFIQFYSENNFELDLWKERLDSLYNKIESYALQDSFRTFDWGFDISDFTNSYYNDYENQHVKRGIRDYVDVRNQSISEQLTFVESDPVVYDYAIYPANPIAGDSIKIVTSAFSANGLTAVKFNYLVNEQNYTILDFSYNPVPGTKKVEENDRWEITIPPVAAGSRITFTIQAVDENSSRYFPQFTSLVINIPGAGSEDLILNEFLAQNTAVNTDENNQYEDWIELYNSGDETLDLSGYYLSDNRDNLTKWQFPETSPLLEANGFLLIWCDEDQNQGILHTNFKLSAAGEFIALVAPDGVTVIDSFTFGAQTENLSSARIPDGSENWVLQTPTPGGANSVTALKEEINIAKNFQLRVFPNPFNSTVQIDYSINKVTDVTIDIYDTLGRVIYQQKIYNQGPGHYAHYWDGKSAYGEIMSSGQYIVQLSAQGETEIKRITLIK